MTLPRLGETMETGRVSAWLKQPGERFRRGETLVEIESDKTVVEMPALADGVLAEILVPAGEDADVGAVLCRYEDGRAAPSAGASPAAAGTAPVAPGGAPVARPPAADMRAVAEPPRAGSGSPALGALRATPRARAAARAAGLALEGIEGTGRRGRIEAADVQARLADSDGGPDGGLFTRSWPSERPDARRVVLLHGLAADVQSWAQLALHLVRAGYTVLALDLPSHGSSASDAASFEEAAVLVARHLERQGGEAFDLVGHSLGGALAARVARRLGPGLVRRLTLLAPAGLDRGIDVGFIRSMARVRSAGALRHLLRRLAVRPPPVSEAQLTALLAELMRGRLAALADSLVDEDGQQVDITADLRELRIPVRLIWGLQDRIIPWTQASEAGSRVAVHLIADAGHVPHWDQPGQVAALFEA